MTVTESMIFNSTKMMSTDIDLILIFHSDFDDLVNLWNKCWKKNRY